MNNLFWWLVLGIVVFTCINFLRGVNATGRNATPEIEVLSGAVAALIIVLEYAVMLAIVDWVLAWI